MNYTSRTVILPNNELILATFWRRSAALLLDFIFLVLLYLFIIALFSLFDMNITKVNVRSIFEVEVEMENTSSYVITLLKIVFGLLPLLYFTFSFYFGKGQTIGKYFLKIKVLSLHHEHLGFWQCIERSLGYFASALEFGFGYLQVFWNPNRMALHDKIGETIVIELPSKKSM
jgi:uncharacterized RDD family membrane protein YckC